MDLNQLEGKFNKDRKLEKILFFMFILVIFLGSLI